MQTKFLNAIKGHSWRYFLAVGAIALTYYLASQFAISTLTLSSEIYPIWPAAGIAQAALLVFGRQLWPGIAIGGFLLSMIVQPANIATASLSAAARTLQAWTGTYLLQRLNFSPRLDRLKDVLGIVGLAAFGSSLINSTIGSIVLCLTGLSSWSNFAAAAASSRLARLLLPHPRRLRPLSPRILTISPSSLGCLSIRPALHGPLQLRPLRLRHLGHSPRQRSLSQTRQQHPPSTVIPASLHRRHRRHRLSLSRHRRRTPPSRSRPAFF